MTTAIRGAITVEKDDENEIKSAVKELCDCVFIANGLKKERICCVILSVTSDIHAFHPAKAVREAGYSFAPLFSCVEPDINGGLPFCIRVMVLVNGFDEKPKHIYLKGAKTLRKDLTEIMNIALDGPAGSGKSTVAKQLAKEYDILYLDTGAMYRAFALGVYSLNVSTKDKDAVENCVGKFDVSVKYENGTQITLLDGKDVSKEIRHNFVSQGASDVGVYKKVREYLVERQREIAKSTSCVLDGRDIGSAVLPDAKYKFFITADSRVRAKRRYDELVFRGENPDFEELHAQILARDKQDTEREFSPLVQAKDAVYIDTSEMSVDEVVEKVKAVIQSKI